MSQQEKIEVSLQERSSTCEFCGLTEGLEGLEMKGLDSNLVDAYALTCSVCRGQISGNVDVAPTHWFCLKEACWSEVPAVQVGSYRMLKKLSSEGWAQDVLGQMYLTEDIQAWADSEDSSDDMNEEVTLDSNGVMLSDGDSVTLVQDLPVKGAGFTAKRGTMVKNIRLIGDPNNIEGRVNKMTLVLKTKFLKKVS